MKNTKIVIIIIAVIILQSCSVYNKPSVSIGEATDKGKVKVITNYGSTILFEKIERRDSVYYGFINNNVKSDSILQIFSDDDIAVYTLDAKKSKRRTRILITVIGISAGTIIGAIILNNIFDFDETGDQLELWIAVFKCLWVGGGCLP
ncbi:MAG: hypothetical protein OEW67_14365 [Cyclobacteriaceae bacterium]|nr:hypothetical protein [Cyclobacteriaceae bacterium]